MLNRAVRQTAGAIPALCYGLTFLGKMWTFSCCSARLLGCGPQGSNYDWGFCISVGVVCSTVWGKGGAVVELLAWHRWAKKQWHTSFNSRGGTINETLLPNPVGKIPKELFPSYTLLIKRSCSLFKLKQRFRYFKLTELNLHSLSIYLQIIRLLYSSWMAAIQ